uniref:TIGR00725 family protein n=1 Tax=candidate division WOR-3 bacterium TaxID=2052148 RepID=A0A7C3NAS3_UNCW3
MYKLIGVIGGSSIDEELFNEAEKIGQMLASFNVPVICGGGKGVMEAVSKGVKSKGGTTIGILPYGKESANPYIDIALATGIGFARNYIIVNSSDLIIAIDGKYGTLTEIGYSLQFEKPIISYKSNIAKELGIREAESIEDIKKFVEENL